MEGIYRQLLTLKTYFVMSHSKIMQIWAGSLVGSKQLKKEPVVVARNGCSSS
jgi:precorrin-4 methylase